MDVTTTARARLVRRIGVIRWEESWKMPPFAAAAKGYHAHGQVVSPGE